MTANDDDDAVPNTCECDNGHEQAGTVCRFCWSRGWRTSAERWPLDYAGLNMAINHLSYHLQDDDYDAWERLDMLAHAVAHFTQPKVTS